MKIDEEGFKSLGSDHKRIPLRMGCKTGSKSIESKFGSSYFNEKQITIIAARVQQEVGKIPGKEWRYSELLHVMTKEIRKEKTFGWKGKKNPKSWSNKEIREAMEKRREASLDHRRASIFREKMHCTEIGRRKN